MSKVIKAVATIAIAIGIAVLAAPTGGASVFLAGALHVSAIVASAIVATTLSIVAGVAMKALGLTAKNSAPSTQNATPQTYRQTIAASQIVYGTRRLGGLLTFYHPKKNGSFHYRYFVIAVAGHRCKGRLRWFLNDQEVTVQSESQGGMVLTGDYANAAWLWFDRGEATTPAFATFVAECDGRWTSAHTGWDIAKVYAKFKLTDAVTSAGMPNITVEVEGKDDIYDPREDEEAFTDNAELVFYDWLSLPRAEGGVGADDDEIDWDFVAANANVCDEQVAAADGGTEERYRFNGIITTGAAPSEIRDSFIVNCAGRFCYSEGLYIMRPGYWVPPSATLGEDDLTAAITVSRYRAGNEVATEVQGTFIDPALLYQAQPFDTQSVPSSSTVSMDLDLAWTTSRGQSERVAAILLKRANAEKTVKWPMNFAGLGVSAMDTLLLDTTRHGLSNYSWTVTDWQLQPDFSIALSLAEENEDIYADGSPNPRDPYAGLATVPAITQPGATAWTLTGNVLTGAGASTPTLIVTGACDDRSADAVLFEYRVHADGQGDDVAWRSGGIEPTTVTEKHITAIAGGLSYDVSVTYRRQKVLGPRRIIGATSAGAVAIDFTNVSGATKPAANATRNVPRGAWSSGTTYSLGDMVTYGGSSYVALGPVPVSTAPTNTTYWTLLVAAGIPGAPGANGTSTYVHVAYANSADGSDSFVTGVANPGRTYIGIYTDTSSAGSGDYQAYHWSRLTGEDGVAGSNGTPGQVGADGRQSYVHFAYANSADGYADFTTGDPGNRTYIGVYSDYTVPDSTNPGDYSWSLIKGADGNPGAAGPPGPSIKGDKGDPGSPGPPGSNGVSPSPAYPAITVGGEGVWTYSYPIPLDNGRTVTLQAEIVANVSSTQAAPANVTVSNQYSTDNSNWAVLSNGSQTVQIANDDEADINVAGTYTNNTGGRQVIYLRTVISRTGNANTYYGGGYAQPS